jgi:hypothetical protein
MASLTAARSTGPVASPRVVHSCAIRPRWPSVSSATRPGGAAPLGHTPIVPRPAVWSSGDTVTATSPSSRRGFPETPAHRRTGALCSLGWQRCPGAANTTIPVLRIFSVDAARHFYVDFLGIQAGLRWPRRRSRATSSRHWLGSARSGDGSAARPAAPWPSPWGRGGRHEAILSLRPPRWLPEGLRCWLPVRSLEPAADPGAGQRRLACIS